MKIFKNQRIASVQKSNLVPEDCKDIFSVDAQELINEIVVNNYEIVSKAKKEIKDSFCDDGKCMC